jgi:hypothetical protein
MSQCGLVSNLRSSTTLYNESDVQSPDIAVSSSTARIVSWSVETTRLRVRRPYVKASVSTNSLHSTVDITIEVRLAMIWSTQWRQGDTLQPKHMDAMTISRRSGKITPQHHPTTSSLLPTHSYLAPSSKLRTLERSVMDNKTLRWQARITRSSMHLIRPNRPDNSPKCHRTKLEQLPWSIYKSHLGRSRSTTKTLGSSLTRFFSMVIRMIRLDSDVE